MFVTFAPTASNSDCSATCCFSWSDAQHSRRHQPVTICAFTQIKLKGLPGLEIRALKFQILSSTFPRARTFEFFRARSRLHRSQILQVNTRWNSYLFETRWKALVEIYTMQSFAPFSFSNSLMTLISFFSLKIA